MEFPHIALMKNFLKSKNIIKKLLDKYKAICYNGYSK